MRATADQRLVFLNFLMVALPANTQAMTFQGANVSPCCWTDREVTSPEDTGQDVKANEEEVYGQCWCHESNEK